MRTVTVPAIINTILAMLLVVLPGCTHTRSLTAYPHIDQALAERLNRDLANHRVAMVLRDGRRVEAQDVRIVGDTVSWRAGTQQTAASQIVDIREFSFRSHLRGALDGLIMGLAIGAPAGALIIDGPKGGKGGPGDRLQAALAGSLGTALWTTAFGAARGSRIAYRVEPTPGASNQQRSAVSTRPCPSNGPFADQRVEAGLAFQTFHLATSGTADRPPIDCSKGGR